MGKKKGEVGEKVNRRRGRERENTHTHTENLFDYQLKKAKKTTQ